MDKVPSVLFVTTIDITLEAFLLPLADHFREAGWRVDALSNGATRNERIAAHFDHRFDVAWSRDPLAPSNLAGTARKVRGIVAEGAYDIVHVHTPIAAFVTRYALRSLPAAGRPVILYTAHGFHFYGGQNPLKHAFFRTLERIAAPWTDYLVTVNREDEEAAFALGIDHSRVRLFPGIGVDTDRFSPDAVSPSEAAEVRAELDVAPDAFLITMVAEFSSVKRHRFALEALARVHDPRVVLALVGDGPLEPAVRAEAVRLGLESRVRFAGYRRDVPALLAASDALLLVSEREGLSRSVLEAMASGKPILGTATRGIADAVGEDAGWIVPKNDVAGLAEAMDQAAMHPDDVARRGSAARRRACMEFAQERIVGSYDGLYREALASRI